MTRVIFLDLDGVLVPWDASEPDPGCVGHLNALVERTGARLVLSSSWREHMALSEVEAVLRAAGLRHPLVDATPILVGQPRHAEITAWLDVHPEVEAFVVLDDAGEMGPLAEQWVQTDEYVGLTEEDVERAVVLGVRGLQYGRSHRSDGR